jgi:hypothetical protein
LRKKKGDFKMIAAISKRLNVFYFFSVSGIVLLNLQTASAQPTTTIFVPSSYVTTSGSDDGQPVQALQTLDDAGMTDIPGTYIQFQAETAGVPYAGYRSYLIPSSVPYDQITALQVLANYQGPSQPVQTWTWQIYDWIYDGWVTIGTNVMAVNEGPWSVLNFNLGGPFANYIDASTGEMRIQVSSNNIAGDANIDYEAVVLTYDPSAPSAGTAYFVSTTGLDTNPGSIDAPWATISHAASTVPAGSTVYVRDGVYSEVVTFAVSGSSADGPITFMSFPGESAIIDATNVHIPPSPGLAPSGVLQITDISYLIVQGFEIRNVNEDNPNLFPAGISIAGTCDHIEIRQNYIHNITNGKYGAHGIGVYGTSIPVGITNLIIDGNELNDLTLGQSESMALNGNIQYWTVSNNVVHDNDNIGIDAIGFEGTASNPEYDQARDGMIIGNLVYNISDNSNPTYPKDDNSADGIYVDGGTRILIDGNIVHDNNLGIEAASEHAHQTSSYVTVSNNLIYSNTGPGLSIGGYSTSVGSTSNCMIVNNTCLYNDTMQTGCGEMQIQYFPTTGVSNNLVENNIFYANDQSLFITSPFKNPVATLNYNLYYTPFDSNPPSWQWNKKYYTSFSSYIKSGNDANSLYADPQFVSTTVPDLYLMPSSPAVDAGNNLGPSVVGTTDISGQPRVQGSNVGLGAYELP